MNRFTRNVSSFHDVYTHLINCNDAFIPTLSSRVNIFDYADKLYTKSERIEFINQGILISFVAFYISDRGIYITNVSTMPKWQGNGISRRIMNELINDEKYKNLDFYLEVSILNKKAVDFYISLGFKDTGVGTTEFLSMKKEGDILKRDYDAEQKDNNRRYAYQFDFDIMHKYMLRSFLPFLNQSGHTLELGAYRGDFTQRILKYSASITCVEASKEAFYDLENRFKGEENVSLVHSTFMNWQSPMRYDNIILTHVLEHVEEPVELLKKIKKDWLAENGKLFLVCPNADAASRQIAVQMNIVNYNAAVTESERLHGHQLTYSFDTLEYTAKQAKFDILLRRGIFFKPLANFQWDKILNETDAISEAYLEGCYQLGEKYPQLCASIFLLCM